MNVTIEPLLNKREVAEWLCVSTATISEWMRGDDFVEPVIRRGKVTRWSRLDVSAWLSSNNSK